jgi:hypothetical protein
MLEEGFEYGEAGVRTFTETYGLLEKITVIEPADNACSEARVTTRLRHRPGASPLLFGRLLMSLGAFVSLEDISDALPAYREEVVSVALNALLAHPDRPFGFGDLIGREFNPETQRREPFLIAATQDLDQNLVYAKEQQLVEEVKASLDRWRKVSMLPSLPRKSLRNCGRPGTSGNSMPAFRWSSATPAWFKPGLIYGLSLTSSSMRPAIPSTPYGRPAGAPGGSGGGRTSTSSSSITPVAPIPAVVTQLLMFGISLESVSRRRVSRRPSSTSTTLDQLGLFRS